MSLLLVVTLIYITLPLSIYMLCYVGYRMNVDGLHDFEKKRVLYLTLSIIPFIGLLLGVVVLFFIVEELFIRASKVKIF